MDLPAAVSRTSARNNDWSLKNLASSPTFSFPTPLWPGTRSILKLLTLQHRDVINSIIVCLAVIQDYYTILYLCSLSQNFR